jgi:hypothetical protein
MGWTVIREENLPKMHLQGLMELSTVSHGSTDALEPHCLVNRYKRNSE